MQTEAPVFTDQLASMASPETQRLAARMAQELFAHLFQASADTSTDLDLKALENQCSNWSQAGENEAAKSLRLALLVTGLDQWGLAYSQAFGLTAIPALSHLIGALRTALDSTAEARFQQFFSHLGEQEADAIDFKIELRRQLHLSLWHAMSACDNEAAAEPILQTLGNLMLALNTHMPTLGWRLMADALAHIQIRLLSDPEATPLAQTGTQQLFASLRQALPQDRYQAILAHSGQAVIAWQQARRSES